MFNPFALAKRLVGGLMPTKPPPDIAAATVREWEQNENYGKRQQYKAQDLCAMFCGVVKVATSRTASGIASNRLRVMRAGKQVGRKGWDVRRVERKDALRIRRTAGLVAQKYANMSDDLEEVIDPMHPFVRLLDTINIVHNPFEMMETTQAGLCLTGNFYWKVVRDGDGVPTEVWPLHPPHVHVVPDRVRIIAGYIYGRGTENEVHYDAADVIHFRNVNPKGDPYHGMGDLEACVNEARLGFEFVAIAQNMLDNGMMPGLVVQDEMTAEQQKQMEHQLRKKNAGTHNAGRHLVLSLSEKGKVTQLNWGEKEMSFLQSADRVDQVVANCFDMPIEFLRMKPGGLSGNTDAMNMWQTYGLMPRGRKIEDVLNARLAPMFGEGLFVCFGPWVQEDEVEQSQVAVAAYNAELITKNEGRRRLGEEPVPDGDDFKARPEPALGFGGGGGEPDEKKEPPKKAAPLRLTGTVAVSAVALMLAPHTAKCCQHPPKAVLKDNLSTGVTERQLETALRVWFDRITPRLVQATGAAGIGVELAGDPAIAASFDDAVHSLLDGLYRAGLSAGAGDVSSRLDAAKLNQALTEGATGYLREYMGKLVQSVTETVDDRIRTALADGIGAGETVTELRDRVEGVMGDVSRYGAERIARTETSRAFLTARETAWSESGVVERKEWLLSADPCPICETIAKSYNNAAIGGAFIPAGATIGLTGGGTFTASYGALMTPPAHPNCQCSMGAVFT